MSNKALALVARGPISQGQWYLESVVPRQIRHDEALVRMVATGICRAEVHIGDATPDIGEDPHIYYPRVLGHEGRSTLSLAKLLENH